MISLIFDTETTGIPRHPNARGETQPRILEWGGVLVDGRGRILKELNLLINPECLPPKLDRMSMDSAGIKKITGIEFDDLAQEPIFADVASQIRPFFAEADQVIAHNLPFDETMMQMDLERAKIVEWPWPAIHTCTAQEHQDEWGRRPRMLQLFEHYTGEPLQQTHRALDDVMALLEICKHCEVLTEAYHK